MKKEKRVLNVLVAGHSQHGKSTLISAIVGKFPDNLDFELSHGTTITLKIIQFHLEGKNLLLNFLDSPGHADFKGSIALGLEFCDLLLLVIAGNEGFQARTYWLYEKAIEKGIPIIIAATKMDLPSAKTKKIESELEKYSKRHPPIIETSGKEVWGIEELIDKISLYLKKRGPSEANAKFIILGYQDKKGMGVLLSIGIISGILTSFSYLTEKFRIRQLFSLKGKPIDEASEGEIVNLSSNVEDLNFELGTIFQGGKFISPKMNSLLAEIKPRKEFHIEIQGSLKFKTAIDILDELKKNIPSFDFFYDKKQLTVLVLGDLQFDYIKNSLENLIDFKVLGSKIKGIITIDKISQAKFNSARVRIIPRFKNKLTVSRKGKKEIEMHDMLGASTAYAAFHLDGLHVDIQRGKNEDDIAQAIAKAIEKVKLIKIIPHQDVIVKVENYSDIYALLDKYDIEILYQSQANVFFLQVKNKEFESFFNSLMKISKGKADIKLFKFNQDEKILSVDPGTRHFGFCLIERNELPSLWYVNLKTKIENIKSKSTAREHIRNELDLFLNNDKEIINKIFVGNGPGSEFIIDFLIDYFNIPCENNECIVKDFNGLIDKDEEDDMKRKLKFNPPEIFLVDEFKTTKEALFHLQQGKLVSEVKSKGFVDHAIAALLIAKKGIKGEIVHIEKKPMKQLYDYVIDTYSGSYSFSSIHNINDVYDLKPGMHLRVKDTSKLDSNLTEGEIITFTGFGKSYNTLHATTLSGNRIIIKFQANVRIKKDFFSIFTPVKERT
ncbi:MAG: GTP-binding protein [Promethearchaeota archaeon]|nr:MAG: GTP-binding protein [Candidatus Lokiarchaeota archaeon]